ncbi:MAG: hypothetical protein HY609_03535 [Deltaproteobacteria bacterium]|nr:hypothetical protein [Deltaproteobacteria bacterium]MBI4223981.1 hypothetical protein [Deltaproteobacteria bacterium]
MTIEFDPRPRGVSQPAQTNESPEQNETASAQSGDFFNADPFVQQTVSEMDLLFSGIRRFERIQEENPTDAIHIPGLDTDLLNPMPVLGSSSRDLTEIIRRYEGLQKNLIERRNNYSHALEGFLRPEEAMDLYDRIEQIDRALLRVDRELTAATRKKEQLERWEERERMRRIEEEESTDERLADLYRRSQP